MTPEDLRADIPPLEETTYLNFGASGPSPRPVVRAATDCLEHHEYAAPGREGMYEAAFGAYEDARSRIASFVGAEADEIALTQSTTDGINRIAASLDLGSDDVVVNTDLEHPAGILPWQRLERHRGVTVRTVPSEAGRLDRSAYAAAVRGATLVNLSSLTWTHGTRLPVRELTEIAHEAGALVVVDAVQSPGQGPLDVTDWGADAVAAAGHKWLLGTWGAGFLYVDSDVVEELVPAAIGYRGVVDPPADEYEFKAGARRFEIGTASPAPYAALETAINLIDGVGVGRIRDRIARLAGRLADGIPANRLLSPADPESGLVTIDVDSPAATVERLADSGIVVRALPHPDAIRASVHAVNTAEDVDALLDALEREW